MERDALSSDHFVSSSASFWASASTSMFDILWFGVSDVLLSPSEPPFLPHVYILKLFKFPKICGLCCTNLSQERANRCDILLISDKEAEKHKSQGKESYQNIYHRFVSCINEVDKDTSTT